jgi:signal transduction histidine kinase
MSVQEWYRPPRQLLTLYLAGTVAATLALVWLGLRLLNQERDLASKRAQERLELAADRAVASLQRSLNELERQLSLQEGTPPAGTVVLSTDRGSLQTRPPHGLAFYPLPLESSPVPVSAFRAAERVELASEEPAKAIPLYRELTRSTALPVRAGALMGLGRCLRKTAQSDAALQVYADLARLDAAWVEGRPADLAARELRCTTLDELGRRDLLESEARELYRDLAAGRWQIARDLWEFIGIEAKRWAGTGAALTPRLEDTVALAYAAESIWNRRPDLPAAGHDFNLYGGRPVLTLWAATPDRISAILAGGEFLDAACGQACEEARVRISLSNPEGKTIYGQVADPQTIRAAVAIHLPWNMSISSANPATGTAEDNARRHTLAAGLAILGALILGSSYFTFRGIRRELTVARLQSEFVSAVSHEFRTPLTSMRQLSDMLAKGRVIREDRRQQYYDVLARESERLHRLVEKLLNFGRAEAGSAQFHFAPVELAGLVREVAAEFQRQAEPCRMELSLPDAPCEIMGEREMLALALWNLFDNAVKYSPERRTAWVTLTNNGKEAAIAVRDEGIGIPQADRRRIFRKFVRGSSTAVTGVRGTGIGLTLVHHIAKGHGGDIKLDSEVGHGSTFTLIVKTNTPQRANASL